MHIFRRSNTAKATNYKESLQLSAKVAMGSDNPLRKELLNNFEEQFHKHVEERFVSTFRCAIKTKEKLFWIEKFLKERGIRYRLYKRIRKETYCGGWFKDKKVVRTRYYLLKIKPKEWQ